MGNDCYNNEENGRSMIEMLGVLAIIGVLSVGGIAGYSKAMHRYRVNKTVEQISLIAGNIRTLYATQKGGVYEEGDPFGKYISLDNNVLKKAKLVPDEMWNGDNMENAWGTGFYVRPAYPEYDDIYGGAFSLILQNITEEACIDIITQPWPEEFAAMYVGSGLLNRAEEGLALYDCYFGAGKVDVSDGLLCRRDNGIPVNIENAIATCGTCTDNKCDIVMTLK